MASRLLPFAGLPLPIANQPGEHVSLVALWIDCVILALGGAIGYPWLHNHGRRVVDQ
jgi:hypothetical protein